MSWRPIETAPKDGTHILIYCPIENISCSVFWGGAWYGTDPMNRLNWIQWPTHWMPLPEPPEQARNEKEGGE